jgi:hypothetical protein
VGIALVARYPLIAKSAINGRPTNWRREMAEGFLAIAGEPRPDQIRE